MKLRRWQEQGRLAKCDLRPLGRHARSVSNRASGLARNDLQLFAGATGTSGTKFSRLGMEHPEAAGSGEVKTFRGGDVVEA